MRSRRLRDSDFPARPRGRALRVRAGKPNRRARAARKTSMSADPPRPACARARPEARYEMEQRIDRQSTNADSANPARLHGESHVVDVQYHARAGNLCLA